MFIQANIFIDSDKLNFISKVSVGICIRTFFYSDNCNYLWILLRICENRFFYFSYLQALAFASVYITIYKIEIPLRKYTREGSYVKSFSNQHKEILIAKP